MSSVEFSEPKFNHCIQSNAVKGGWNLMLSKLT